LSGTSERNSQQSVLLWLRSSHILALQLPSALAVGGRSESSWTPQSSPNFAFSHFLVNIPRMRIWLCSKIQDTPRDYPRQGKDIRDFGVVFFWYCFWLSSSEEGGYSALCQSKKVLQHLSEDGYRWILVVAELVWLLLLLHMSSVISSSLVSTLSCLHRVFLESHQVFVEFTFFKVFISSQFNCVL
jgi:hypothetical protein